MNKYLILTLVSIFSAQTVSASGDYAYSPRYSAGDYGYDSIILKDEVIPPSATDDLIRFYLKSNNLLPPDMQSGYGQGYYAPEPMVLGGTQGALNNWQEIRSKYINLPLAVELLKTDEGSWNSYVNCLPGTFELASGTLEERAKVYTKEQLITWIRNQDSVFRHCGDNSSAIPSLEQYRLSATSSVEVVKPGLFRRLINWLFGIRDDNRVQFSSKQGEEMLIGDTAYQAAAEDFYLGNYSVASTKFKEIESESGVWAPYAALALARIEIRQAKNIEEKWYPSAGEKEQMTANFVKAKGILETIVQNPSYKIVHEAADSLLALVNVRIDKVSAVINSEQKLLGASKLPTSGMTYFTDFTLAFDALSEGDRNLVNKDGGDLSRWLIYIEHISTTTPTYPLEQWRKTKTTPWLIAALKYISYTTSVRVELFNAAKKVDQTNDAYPTFLLYQLLELHTEGQDDRFQKEYMENLTTIDSSWKAVLHSLVNSRLMLEQKTTEGYFAYAKRYIKDESRIVLDRDAQRVLNYYIPTKEWGSISNYFVGDIELQKQILLVALSRASLLGDHVAGVQIAKQLSAIDDKYAPRLVKYLKAKTEEEKSFYLATFFLEFAGVPVMIGHDTISLLENDGALCSGAHNETLEALEQSRPSFIGSEQLTQNLAENKLLTTVIPSTKYINDVLTFAKMSPDSVDVPEALYLATWSIRYAHCKDGNSATLSKSAFSLLHTRYPDSEWTKKTPYYFN